MAGVLEYGRSFISDLNQMCHHDGTKKTKKHIFFYLCIIFYQISCVIFSYIPFTFPQTSKLFLSNSIKKMHILALGPELQAFRCGYVILGENA